MIKLTLTASNFRISNKSLDTFTYTDVASVLSVGIVPARVPDAGDGAGVVAQLAVPVVRAVVVHVALDADALRALDHSWRTDALGAVLVGHKAAGGVADALVADQDEPELDGTTDAVTVVVHIVAGRTNTVVVLVQDQAFPGWAGGNWNRERFVV